MGYVHFSTVLLLTIKSRDYRTGYYSVISCYTIPTMNAKEVNDQWNGVYLISPSLMLLVFLFDTKVHVFLRGKGICGRGKMKGQKNE